MATLVYQKPCFRIFIDEEKQVIYEQWTGKLSLEEWQEALEVKLKLFKDHQVNLPDLKWLNDTRGLQDLSPEAQVWAVKEFHPLLYPAGIRKIAFIVPEQIYLNLTDEYITGKFDAAKQIFLCYFDEFEEGVAWITQD